MSEHTQRERDTLEADLDLWERTANENGIRAEKAEAIVKDQAMAIEAGVEMLKMETARAEKAEAALAEVYALLGRAIGFGLGGSWEHEAADLLKRAAERESETLGDAGNLESPDPGLRQSKPIAAAKSAARRSAENQECGT
jgi:hypothetical protein